MLVLVITLLVILTVPATAEAAVERARPAPAFVDSVGVNIHSAYTDTAYGDYDHVFDALRHLGVRHVRDGMYVNAPELYRRYRALDAAGIRLNLVMGEPGWRYGTLDQLVTTLKKEIPSAVDSVEGPNEYNKRHQDDPNWPSDLRGYQEQLFAAIKRDPALRHLAVLGPSVTDPMADRDRLGDISSVLDYGNAHPYTGGDAPGGAHLALQLALAAKNSGSKPPIATEAGFHNALNQSRPQHPISESAAAVYSSRTLLEHFRSGIVRTYLYELLDEKPEAGLVDQEQHFGLLRNDFSEKPAALAIGNLLALLRDGGGRFAPGQLDLRLSGAVGVNHLLLQKSDGRFFLALWQARPVWDHERKVDLDTRPVGVQLRTNPSMAAARLYRPGRSTSPQMTLTKPRVLTVDVPADPVLLELKPRGLSAVTASRRGPRVLILRASPRRVRNTSPIRLHGRLRSKYARVAGVVRHLHGRRVSLLMRDAGRWRKIGRTRMRRNGRFRAVRRIHAPRRSRWVLLRAEIARFGRSNAVHLGVASEH